MQEQEKVILSTFRNEPEYFLMKTLGLLFGIKAFETKV